MKLVKLVNNPDYTRFSKTIEVEVNGFITAKIDAYGGLNTLHTSLGDFLAIEDMDININYYIGGEISKKDGFKELYNKLFKSSFEDFEESIENFCGKAVEDCYTSFVGHLNKKSRIKILRELINKCDTFVTNDYVTMITRYWEINQLLNTFGNGFTQPSIKVTDMDGNTRYGINLNKVIEVVDTLAK
jgi:hypothetical protein